MTLKSNMQTKEIIKNYKTKKEVKTKRWQELAIDACQYLVNSPKAKSSIFKCYKLDSKMADISLQDCKELGKPFSKYFLKVFNSLYAKNNSNSSSRDKK